MEIEFIPITEFAFLVKIDEGAMEIHNFIEMESSQQEGNFSTAWTPSKSNYKRGRAFRRLDTYPIECTDGGKNNVGHLCVNTTRGFLTTDEELAHRSD